MTSCSLIILSWDWVRTEPSMYWCSEMTFGLLLALFISGHSRRPRRQGHHWMVARIWSPQRTLSPRSAALPKQNSTSRLEGSAHATSLFVQLLPMVQRRHWVPAQGAGARRRFHHYQAATAIWWGAGPAAIHSKCIQHLSMPTARKCCSHDGISWCGSNAAHYNFPLYGVSALITLDDLQRESSMNINAVGDSLDNVRPEVQINLEKHPKSKRNSASRGTLPKFRD